MQLPHNDTRLMLGKTMKPLYLSLLLELLLCLGMIGLADARRFVGGSTQQPVTAMLVISVIGAAHARLLFQHFNGGVVVSSPGSVWTSPLGSTVVYPTGTTMGASP